MYSRFSSIFTITLDSLNTITILHIFCTIIYCYLYLVVRLFFLDTLARFQVGVGIPVSAEDIILQTFDNDDRKLQVCVCMLWKSNRKNLFLKTDFYNVCLTRIQHAWILLSIYHNIPNNNYIIFYIILFFLFFYNNNVLSTKNACESLFVGMPRFYIVAI